MTTEQLIAAFRGYLDAGDGYIPGTAGETWTQAKQDKMAAKNAMVQRYGARWIGHHVEDCSGAFVRAYKAHGLSIYHGSNAIARKYTVELLPVSAAAPGMAAFKVRKPGEKGYALPTAYRKGPDLNDYYHIGLVDADGVHVINAQSTQTGVVRSKLSDGWDYVGWLKDIQRNGGDKKVESQYIVIADKVNMRVAPNVKADRVEYLNNGDIVEVGIEYPSGWDYVIHGKKSGYVLAQYLKPIETSNKPVEPSVNLPNEELIQLIYKALEANEKAAKDIEEERQALLSLQQLLAGTIG